ncbi:MAG: sugar transferase [Sandaracinaceae bacterium]
MDARRALDLILAAGALHVFAPVQAAAAVAIRLEDGGPVLFAQERLGRDRRPFRILKLRTMRDGQVTRVGRYLRATGLDETAQFLCVLRGDMSIVGPRPLTAADVERLGWSGPEHDARFAVPPGITGLAQVYGGVSARHSRALDALYARRASVGLDLRLIGVSFAMNVVGKARVRRWLRRPAHPS